MTDDVRKAIWLTLQAVPREERTSLPVREDDRDRVNALAEKLGWTRQAVVHAALSLLWEETAEAGRSEQLERSEQPRGEQS